MFSKYDEAFLAGCKPAERPKFRFYRKVADLLEGMYPGEQIWKVTYFDIEAAVELTRPEVPEATAADVSWAQGRIVSDHDSACYYRGQRGEAITGMLVEAAGNLLRERRAGR